MTNLTSTHYFKKYSEEDMEAIKQELSEADISLSPAKPIQDIGLKPLNWQEGDIAISPTHFYMIYNDPEKGITVRSINRVTGTSDTHYGFLNREDAQDWIKNNHYLLVQNQLDYCAAEHGICIGQRWLNKHTDHVILEIAMVEDGSLYIRMYSLHGKDSNKQVIGTDVSSLKQYLENSYFLMLDGETAADCLIRCRMGSEIL